MATMVPAAIPEAPEDDQMVFNLLREDPATDGWVIFYSVKVTAHDQRERKIDFLALVPDSAILCMDVRGGGYEVKQGQWYALWSREMVDRPGRQVAKAMYGLDDQLRDHFAHWGADAELPMDCVILFTDTTWPPHLRPLAHPTIGLPDLEFRFQQSLGERLLDIAKETREEFPDSVGLDSQIVEDIQNYLLAELPGRTAGGTLPVI